MRVTGLWPATCFGSDDLPLVLPSCRLCGEPDILVAHCLCECEGTRQFVGYLPPALAGSRGNCKTAFLSALFCIEGELAQRVAYVCKCISGLLLADPAAAGVDLPVWEGIGLGENEEDLMSVSSEEA